MAAELRKIAIISIMSQPLFAWLGLLTLILLIATASYGYFLAKGRVRSLSSHKQLAALTLACGVAHAILALTTLI